MHFRFSLLTLALALAFTACDSAGDYVATSNTGGLGANIDNLVIQTQVGNAGFVGYYDPTNNALSDQEASPDIRSIGQIRIDLDSDYGPNCQNNAYGSTWGLNRVWFTQNGTVRNEELIGTLTVSEVDGALGLILQNGYTNLAITHPDPSDLTAGTLLVGLPDNQAFVEDFYFRTFRFNLGSPPDSGCDTSIDASTNTVKF